MNEVSIDPAKCIYCKTCVTICPWGVYSDEGDHIGVSKMEQCVACMSCIPACPVDAITVKEEM
ncbi:MAG: 4Fe-4S binding protein [Candidatus Bathyarchaeota archaeon]|nr:4Fe-4S binding protein [Candidatus Bathyarchaeota archaeon]